MSRTLELNRVEDQGICEALLSSPRWVVAGKKTVDELVVMVGKSFLGIPYKENTIESEGIETLVVNLRQFDCFTFVENVIVLAQLIHAGKTGFDDFIVQLKKIRYRQGAVAGYASRLHYFSDWLDDNREKGMVSDITAEIGGTRVLKEIHFMTKHPGNYPAMKDGSSCREIMAVEKRLSAAPRYVIPKAGFWQFEGRIGDGNLIGITTDVEGLDVSHTGFAVWMNEHVHLLHASQKEGRVVISENTLGSYLSEGTARSGIMVGQVLTCRNVSQDH